MTRTTAWLALLTLPAAAWAYDPPAFDPAQRLARDGADSFRMEEALPAATASELRIFSVVTDRAGRSGRGAWANPSEHAIERTWETWSSDPAFDPATDILVLVALDERTTLVKTGSTWDVEYGLHNDALKTITDRSFVPRARAGDVGGALADTISDIDTTFRSYRDLPPSVPEAADGRFEMTPPSPVLPRVQSGLAALRQAEAEWPESVQLVVAQRLPDRTSLSAVAESVLPNADEAIAIVWDVRGDRLAVALGPAFDEVEVDPATVATPIRETSTNQDGKIAAAPLAASLRGKVGHLRKTWLNHTFNERRAWFFDPGQRGPLRTSPPELFDALPQTRAALDRMRIPVHLAVADRADNEGQADAPGGRAWVVHAHRDHRNQIPEADRSRSVVITVIDEPRAWIIDGGDALTVDGFPVKVGADTAGLGGPLPLDAFVHNVLGLMDEAVRTQVNLAQAEAAAAEAERQRIARNRRVGAWTAGGVGLTTLSLFGIGGMAWQRRRRKSVFVSAKNGLERSVRAARDRLDDLRLDQEMKARIRAIQDQGPQTSELFAQVSRYLDHMELGVRSLERRMQDLDRGLQQAERGVDPRDYDQLTVRLEAPVRIAAEGDDADLFAPLEQERVVPLDAFMAELNDNYRLARDGVALLHDAARARLRRLDDDLNRQPLDELRGRLSENDLPAAWLDHHPLVDNQTELDTLDALRQADPVAYVRALTALQERCVDIESSLDLLFDGVQLRHGARAAALDAQSAPVAHTIAPPDSDPVVAVAEARTFDRLADAHIAEATTLPEAIDAVGLAALAWREVHDRVQALRAALNTAPDLVAEARQTADRARQELEAHHRTVDGLAQTHANIDGIRELLKAAATDISEAYTALGHAEGTLAADRHLEAVRHARQVELEVTESAQDIAALVTAVAKQRQVADQVRSQVALLDQIRRGYADSAANYGSYGVGVLAEGDQALKRLRGNLDLTGRVDWVAHAAAIKALRREWASGVETARAEHQAAKAAAAAAAAAARARRQAAWSASSSYSSSSSSSSSSWSSSSSSSSWSSSSSSGGSSWSSSSSSGGSSYGGGSSRSGGSSW